MARRADAGGRRRPALGRRSAPGGSHRRLVELGVAAERPTGIVFLPYLEGERSPIWDPTARGAFVGIEAHHGPVHFAVAVLEGVAFWLPARRA